MKTTMKKVLLLAGLLTTQLWADNSPVGYWKTFDEKTNNEKSLIEIFETPEGTLSGRIIRLFEKPGAVCAKCSGTRKDQPIEGMVFLWGLKKTGEKWSEGQILDPESGDTYTSEMEVTDAGQALKVTGKFLVFSRSQVWQKSTDH